MKAKTIATAGVSIFVWAMATLLVFGSAGAPANAAGDPQYGGILKNAERSGPTKSIGIPWEMRGADSQAMKPSVEALFRQDQEGKIHPVLATEWTIAPDKSSVTIKLRQGVKFHDGSDFNADVAKWNMDKKIENRARGTANWESVEKLDDYTIRVNLKNFENFMLNGMTATGGAMISQKAFEEKGADYCRWNPIGTGPFIFESFTRDVVTKYKKNPNYWNKDLPYLDGLELHYIKDSMTQQAAIQKGEIDVLGVDTGKMAADLRDMGFKIKSGEDAAVVLIPDSKNPDSPFFKKEVREALGYAIDREAIVKARGFGFWSPAYQVVFAGNPGHIPNFKGRQYDPEKAKQLLKEAGYPNGFKTKIIPMSFGTDKDVWVAVQAYLGAVGIQVELDFVPYSKYTEYRFKGWHGSLLGQPLGIYPNANQTYDFYFSENVKMVQFTSMKRPEGFAELVEKSKTAADMDPALIQEIGKMVYDDAMIIPIHTKGRAYVHQKNVYDTGHMEWGMWTEWRHDKAWKSK